MVTQDIVDWPAPECERVPVGGGGRDQCSRGGSVLHGGARWVLVSRWGIGHSGVDSPSPGLKTSPSPFNINEGE